MIMSGTCTTHQSQVPWRSSGRIKEEQRQWKGREDQDWTFICVLCAAVVHEGLPFTFVFGYFVIKVFKCLPVPASFFPIYKLCYIGDNEKIESDINLLHIFLAVEQATVGKFAKWNQIFFVFLW